MGQARSGWPRQGRSGTLGLLTVLESFPIHCQCLGEVTSIQPLDLSGPRSPHSAGQGCVTKAMGPPRPRPGGGGEGRAQPRLGWGQLGPESPLAWHPVLCLLQGRISGEALPLLDLGPSGPHNVQPWPLSLHGVWGPLLPWGPLSLPSSPSQSLSSLPPLWFSPVPSVVWGEGVVVATGSL